MPATRTRDTHSRPLEVATDALQAQPPTLSIISPTPRAFTFPIHTTHPPSEITTATLTDSPFSSPSNSPFEPDHRPSCTTSPPSSMRTLTPDTTISSVSLSSSPHNHKRRKSSTCSDIERRPKKGDDDYIKRPENAFILFRRKCCEDRQNEDNNHSANGASTDGPAKKQRQADLSKTISQQWKSLGAEERQYWEHLAKEKKKEHEQMYPNYVYRPQRAKDKDGRSKSRKPKNRVDDPDSDGVSFVLPMSTPQLHQSQSQPRLHYHGRSASVPTPPPFQAIQIPNVYQLPPSCPTSPSLLPMIARRSSHPDHEGGALTNFDYIAPNQQLQPPFSGYEASLQPSEFVRSMFNIPTLPLDPQSYPPSLQIISPSASISGSSGPSSPTNGGPFTPMSSTFLTHHHPFAPHQHHLDPDSTSSLSQPHSQAELDLQMEMQQLQQQYASYSWDTDNNAGLNHNNNNNNNATSLWPSNADHHLLLGNDFDLGAIPPIELGLPIMPKFGNEEDVVGGGDGGGARAFDLDTSGMGLGVADLGVENGDMGSLEFGHEFGQALVDGGGISAFDEDVSSHPGRDGLMGFDDMMAGHGF